jgi:hypothetical protein
MYTSLVISGSGVKKGATIPHTSNLNIAPTIAKLLRINLPNATGTVIASALE